MRNFDQLSRPARCRVLWSTGHSGSQTPQSMHSSGEDQHVFAYRSIHGQIKRNHIFAFMSYHWRCGHNVPLFFITNEIARSCRMHGFSSREGAESVLSKLHAWERARAGARSFLQDRHGSLRQWAPSRAHNLAGLGPLAVSASGTISTNQRPWARFTTRANRAICPACVSFSYSSFEPEGFKWQRANWGPCASRAGAWVPHGDRRPLEDACVRPLRRSFCSRLG